MSRIVVPIASALVWCLVGFILGSSSSPLFADAFSCSPAPILQSTRSSATSATTLFVSRRAALESAMAFTLGSIVLTPSLVRAEDGSSAVDDLSMPSTEEQKQSEDDAMQERLRRKAELQKAKTRPATFQESMQMEMKKQDSLKKSQMERRNAMCEELGRGC